MFTNTNYSVACLQNYDCAFQPLGLFIAFSGCLIICLAILRCRETEEERRNRGEDDDFVSMQTLTTLALLLVDVTELPAFLSSAEFVLEPGSSEMIGLAATAIFLVLFKFLLIYFLSDQTYLREKGIN